MMNYNELDARIIKERVDMAQLWDAWSTAEDLRRHSFLGSMNWENRNGRQYLYSRRAKISKSLGPRSPETEQTFQAFTDGKQANKLRLASLSSEMEQQAGVLRSLNAGRLPMMAARTLRTLRQHGGNTGIRVEGTNALYAYETLGGVRFNTESTATGDIDLLVDDRNRLRLLTDAEEQIGLIRLIQAKVDKTFTARGARDFRLTNDRGYMIEFIRPQPNPIYRKMDGAQPIEDGDVEPAPIMGLQWLVNAPAIDAIVLDERGFPAPMRCPDPRYWAMHKLWLSTHEDRAADKKQRDREQANVLLQLITEKMPHLALDDHFMALIPNELRERIPEGENRTSTMPSW